MKEIKLDGLWQVRAREIEENKYGISRDKTYSMEIPGDLHSALIEKGIIPDPYYGRNELDILFLSRGEWEVSRDFNYTPSGKKAYLRLEKLDTTATLYINGKMVSEHDNIHRIYFVDITKYLKKGTNTISFVFHSAEKVAAERNASLPYPVPCSLYPNGSPHRNLVRKTQCAAGWDWGPCIMALGVYVTPVIIESDSIILKDFAITLEKTKKEWKLNYELFLLGIDDEDESVITITILNKDYYFTIKNRKGDFKVTEKISIDASSVELWWPNGMGRQKLYSTRVTAGGMKKKRRIGFRTIEVKNKTTYGGKELTISVNGKDVFIKGSNWIPLDALPSRMTKERYDSMLKDVEKANMNALRIWGGGWYEKEEFYDAADRYGILIWHDMMFACSTYPAEKWFLESVKKEIEDQIRRLKSRTCIALWCGNNEDLGALGWYDETKENRERYLKDYEALNDETVGKTVMKEDRTRIFWPSSPCGGPGDYGDNWHSDGNGDMHFWSVWHEGKEFDFYHSVKPRFSSEFGYQSFPSPYTVKSFAPESEYSLLSPVMLHHQKNDMGNEIIINEFKRTFKEPESFTDGLYLSLVQQALAIETAVTYWRSLMPYCMGTIIWQLNDVWPVSSWSSIEYSGKWKPLHYAIKHFYAPLTPLLYKDDGKYHVDVINETDQKKKVELVVTEYSFKGEKLSEEIKKLSIEPQSVFKVEEKEIKENRFLFVKLESGKIREERSLFLHRPNEEKVERSGIKVESVKKENEEFRITISASNPAFFVVLDTPFPGHFSDNYFALLPGDEKVVTFRAEKKDIKEDELEKELVLWDISKVLA